MKQINSSFNIGPCVNALYINNTLCLTRHVKHMLKHELLLQLIMWSVLWTETVVLSNPDLQSV